MRARLEKRPPRRPIRRRAGISRAAAAPSATPAHITSRPSPFTTNRPMTDTAALLVACSAMKPATTDTSTDLDTGTSGGPATEPPAGMPEPSTARRRAIMRAVVAILRTATAARAGRMARLPRVPMIKVARGGPATHATETMARVFTMSAGRAPACLRWAKRSELPTPAGPPRAIRPTTATGSEVVDANSPVRARVRAPHARRGRR
jgi:hypothetical protein